MVTDSRAAGHSLPGSELCAGVAVDFHADGNLDDFRALPLPHVGPSFSIGEKNSAFEHRTSWSMMLVEPAKG
jgi:hypothetical protein